jgi:hypothetical protein
VTDPQWCPNLQQLTVMIKCRDELFAALGETVGGPGLADMIRLKIAEIDLEVQRNV